MKNKMEKCGSNPNQTLGRVLSPSRSPKPRVRSSGGGLSPRCSRGAAFSWSRSLPETAPAPAPTQASSTYAPKGRGAPRRHLRRRKMRGRPPAAASPLVAAARWLGFGLWEVRFRKMDFTRSPAPARSWGFWAGSRRGRKETGKLELQGEAASEVPRPGASERRGGADPLRPRIQSDTPSVLLLLSLALFYNFVSINPGRALVL